MITMSGLAASRKEKRWAVYARAHSVTLDNSSIVLESYNIDYRAYPEDIAIGATQFTCSNTPTYVKAGSYLCLDPLDLNSREMVQVDTVDQATKIITLKTATTISHPKLNINGYDYGVQFTGGYHSQLLSEVSAGLNVITAKDSIGLVPGTNLVVGYETDNAELVTIVSVTENQAYLNKGLSFDHADSECIEEYDSTNTTQGSDTRVIYDIVYGHGSGYVAVSDSQRLPWIVELETSSFDEAKAKAALLSNKVGLENVRVDRIVDLSQVLYPIS